MIIETSIARKIGEEKLITSRGEFTSHDYVDLSDGKIHTALTLGDVSTGLNVLTRLHSSCLTGDVLGSLRCDCGDQLSMAKAMIAEEGRGIILYLNQEGRGIGLMEKLRAYELQDQGLDTVDANLALGHAIDERSYAIAVDMLTDLGVRQVRLMTNNPDKVDALMRDGIDVSERVPLVPPIRQEYKGYLIAKRNRTAHIILGLT